MKIHSPVLINVEGMPGSFEELDRIPRPGDVVNLSDFTERFWVLVTKRDGDLFVGRVKSYLAAGKPYGCGELIRFGVENVYEVFEGPDVRHIHGGRR